VSRGGDCDIRRAAAEVLTKRGDVFEVAVLQRIYIDSDAPDRNHVKVSRRVKCHTSLGGFLEMEWLIALIMSGHMNNLTLRLKSLERNLPH